MFQRFRQTPVQRFSVYAAPETKTEQTALTEKDCLSKTNQLATAKITPEVPRRELSKELIRPIAKVTMERKARAIPLMPRELELQPQHAPQQQTQPQQPLQKQPPQAEPESSQPQETLWIADLKSFNNYFDKYYLKLDETPDIQISFRFARKVIDEAISHPAWEAAFIKNLNFLFYKNPAAQIAVVMVEDVELLKEILKSEDNSNYEMIWKSDNWELSLKVYSEEVHADGITKKREELSSDLKQSVNSEPKQVKEFEPLLLEFEECDVVSSISLDSLLDSPQHQDSAELQQEKQHDDKDKNLQVDLEPDEAKAQAHQDETVTEQTVSSKIFINPRSTLVARFAFFRELEFKCRSYNFEIDLERIRMTLKNLSENAMGYIKDARTTQEDEFAQDVYEQFQGLIALVNHDDIQKLLPSFQKWLTAALEIARKKAVNENFDRSMNLRSTLEECIEQLERMLNPKRLSALT